MNITNAVNSLYLQVKNALHEKLSHLGYQPVHEENHDAVFGSRYMLWSNDMEAISFCWDGKERWFALEITEDLPLKPLSRWEQLLRIPFKPTEYSIALTNEITGKFLKSLA